MLSTKKFIGHCLPMVLVITLGSLDSISATKQCKSIVMTAVMKHCSDVGTRAKRELGPPQVQLQEIEPDAEIEYSEYRYPSRRQLDSGAAIGSVAAPLASDMITDALTRRRVSSAMGERYAPAPYPVPIAAPYPGAPRYYIAAAPPPAPSLFQSESRFGGGFLPQESGSDLGFDLSIDELDELYNEVSQRIARNSPINPDEAKRVFLEAAAKCCQNEELCRKEKIIPCV